MINGCLVMVTYNDLLEAEKQAKSIVERKLGACVNIIDRVKSVYIWENKTCVDDEYLCLIKTTHKNIPALKAFIEEFHSYETPECIVLEIKDGSAPYLQWLTQTCS